MATIFFLKFFKYNQPEVWWNYEQWQQDPAVVALYNLNSKQS